MINQATHILCLDFNENLHRTTAKTMKEELPKCGIDSTVIDKYIIKKIKYIYKMTISKDEAFREPVFPNDQD